MLKSWPSSGPQWLHVLCFWAMTVTTMAVIPCLEILTPGLLEREGPSCGEVVCSFFHLQDGHCLGNCGDWSKPILYTPDLVHPCRI